MKYWDADICFRALLLTTAFITGYAAARQGNFNLLASCLTCMFVFYADLYLEDEHE